MQKLETAWLEITSSCNLECKYCYLDTDKDKRSMYSIQQFNKIISLLAKLNIKNIILSGGEPCLHPKICDFIEIAVNKNFSVGVATNGTFISEELLKCFLDNKVFLQISLDSISEKEYLGICGKNMFLGVSNNIIRIVERNIPVTLSCTLSNLNYGSAIDICNFAIQNSISFVHFGILVPTKRCIKNHVSFDNFYDVAMDLYNYQLKNYYDIHIDFIEEIVSLLSSYDAKITASPVSFSCNAMAGKNIQIDVCGNVRQCGLINRLDCFNIFENDLTDEQEITYAILSQIKPISSFELNDCSDCKFLSICRGGCRACAYHTTGNVYGKTPYCYDIQRFLGVVYSDYQNGKLQNYIKFLYLMKKANYLSESIYIKKHGIY